MRLGKELFRLKSVGCYQMLYHLGDSINNRESSYKNLQTEKRMEELNAYGRVPVKWM